jgi:hypothetical protein
MGDVRDRYFKTLEESAKPRAYWRGSSPEESGDWAGAVHLFETVEDDGGRIAVKQIVMRRSGIVNRYWWRHLEDQDGFLTDQPIHYTDELEPISAEEFQHHWAE